MKSEKLKKLTDEEIIAFIEALMWFWGSSHQKWRLAVEDEYGLDAALRIERKLIGDVGKAHGKVFKKIFHIGEGISEFIRASTYAPENYLEGYVLESCDENHATFYNPSCSVQKARLQKGLKEYPCKDMGIRYFENFAKQIDPRITLECVVAPPDQHPEDVNCKWRVTCE